MNCFEIASLPQNHRDLRQVAFFDDCETLGARKLLQPFHNLLRKLYQLQIIRKAFRKATLP